MVRLDGLVREKFQLSWGKARSHIETGKVWVNGEAVLEPGAPTAPDSRIELRMSSPRRPAGSATAAGSRAGGAGVRAGYGMSDGPEPRVVHSDTQLIVVSKPAGMSTVPFEDEPDHSLERWARAYLRQTRVGVVQRLDRETSGLIVFTRTVDAEQRVANLFRFRRVTRRYFALVHGQVRSQTIESELVENRGDGLRGSRRGHHAGDDSKLAITHVRALATFAGMTLIECRLETGRTHQIRIHLSEAGHPLVGEKLYIREYEAPRVEAPRLMLHAAELGFLHPTREVPMRWTELPPPDFLALLPESALRILKERVTK